MIVAKLSGRLGNQMFQYATARSLAARVGTEVKLDTSWIEYEGAGGPARRYELDCFDLDVQVDHVRNFARLPAERRMVRALQRLRPRRRPFLTVIREAAFSGFVPQVLTAGDDVYLDGYWQSEDYFKQHAPLIRRDFTFRDELSETGAALAREIARHLSVSVHVRRGDYVNSRFIHSLDADHYRLAVELVAREIGDFRIFVFSDEPDWCEAKLRFDHPTVVVHNETEDAADRSLEDVHLMSLCDHHVVANSTFSWWGAWLDANPEKIVVAPRRWFRDPSRENSEPRVPRDWIRI